MKNILFGFFITILFLASCQQEAKKAANVIPNYQEMQQVASDVEKGMDSLHIYQGAIRDMLHSFEASFPKDTFTVKLRSQLSELNKVEYTYNEWKKMYNGNWDTLKTDKAGFANRGKSDITTVKDAFLFNVKSSRNLIQLLKSRGIYVTNDPTIKK
jgi:hypothetical protein